MNTDDEKDKHARESEKRASFLAEANRIADITDNAGLLDKPWQDWFLKVLFRFARVFVPELSLSDFQENPEKFFGTLAGLQMEMSKHLESADLTECAEASATKTILKQLRGGMETDHAAIKETQSRAMDLPVEGRLTFYAALGTTVESQVAARLIQRVLTSPTLKICFFLILNRRSIENHKFDSSAKCFEAFRKTNLGRGGPAGNGETTISMKAQFQKICSECGVRFSNRGRRRANSDGAHDRK